MELKRLDDGTLDLESIELSVPTVRDRIRMQDMVRMKREGDTYEVVNAFSVLLAWACLGTGMTEDELFETFGNDAEALIPVLGAEVRERAFVNPKKG